MRSIAIGGSEYVIEGEIGRGGMGIVLKARDLTLDRQVAVKLLQGAEQGGINAELFRREGRMLAKLPPERGIVPVHAADEVWWDGRLRLCLVMGFIDGRSLADLVDDPEPPPASALLAWCAQVCEALAVAHERGVIHRDVKPSNVMISDGHAWLIDFGIARTEGDRSSSTGHLIGTPPYMSPEQASNMPLTGLSDLYSVGVMLFELLTGELPFQHQAPPRVPDGWASYLATVCTAHPPSLTGGPWGLGAVLDSLLRRVGSGRPPFRDGTSAAKGLAAVAGSCRRAETGESMPLAPIRIADDLGSERVPAKGSVEIGAEFSYAPDRLDSDPPAWASPTLSHDTYLDWQRKHRFRNRRPTGG
ncbi:serine/threonine-protein kinase [Streptomyces sp. NPDC018031]|uniref:serine/threonine-protein kinase n=1 Tax=Streptomyces sp. NPDC018031 TaxID=3365033 RepID=UPI003790F65D